MSWVPALDGWLVTRYDLALAVMRDPVTFTVDDERFSTAQLVGPSMLSLDGPSMPATARRSRRRFARRGARALHRRRRQAECDALLDELAAQGRATCARSSPDRWLRGVLTRRARVDGRRSRRRARRL